MKTKNARKSNKSVKVIKGQPGAPKKTVKYPRGNFTVAEGIKFNAKNTCGLTVRNRITEDVDAGLLVENGLRHQPNGNVGRPSTLYILATLKKVTKNKVVAKATLTKTARKVKANTVVLAPVLVVESAQPNPAPVTNVAAPVIDDTAPVSGEKNIPAVTPLALP